MESIFENEYILSKEYYNDWYKLVFFKMQLLMVILLGFGFFIAIGSFFMGNGDGGSIYLLFLAPFLLYIQFLGCSKAKKSSLERDLEINNGNPVKMKYIVTNEGIEINNLATSSHRKISFFLIRKVTITKNYYLLITPSQLYYIFKKDSFTKGSPNDFLTFLASKRIPCYTK